MGRSTIEFESESGWFKFKSVQFGSVRFTGFGQSKLGFVWVTLGPSNLGHQNKLQMYWVNNYLAQHQHTFGNKLIRVWNTLDGGVDLRPTRHNHTNDGAKRNSKQHQGFNPRLTMPRMETQRRHTEEKTKPKWFTHCFSPTTTIRED